MKRALVLLAAASFLAVGTFAAAQEKEEAQPQEKIVKRQTFKDQLNLTREQEAKIKALQEAGRTEMKAYREEMQKLRTEMQALRKDGQPDTAKMEPLIDKMYKLRADQAKARLKRSREWRKVLTPEQLELLKDRPIGMMFRGARSEGPGRMNFHVIRRPEMGRHFMVVGPGQCQCPCCRQAQPGWKPGTGAAPKVRKAEPGQPEPPAPPAPEAPPAPPAPKDHDVMIDKPDIHFEFDRQMGLDGRDIWTWSEAGPGFPFMDGSEIEPGIVMLDEFLGPMEMFGIEDMDLSEFGDPETGGYDWFMPLWF